MQNKPFFLTANWAAPKTVKTIITTRGTGYSKGCYAGFNLATHVNDNEEAVLENRLCLNKYLPDTPFWLNQIHSDKVINIDHENPDTFDNNADAAITTLKNKVCVVMTADCLPIFLTNKSADFVAAVHAGWRGVANGIIGNSITKAATPPSETLAFIGPTICQKHFEVGEDVLDIFIKLDPENISNFVKSAADKYNCNLQAIAKSQMINLGVKEENISISQKCTVCDNHLFFSYRKDGVTGRCASLIWLD